MSKNQTQSCEYNSTTCCGLGSFVIKHKISAREAVVELANHLASSRKAFVTIPLEAKNPLAKSIPSFIEKEKLGRTQVVDTYKKSVVIIYTVDAAKMQALFEKNYSGPRKGDTVVLTDAPDYLRGLFTVGESYVVDSTTSSYTHFTLTGVEGYKCSFTKDKVKKV